MKSTLVFVPPGDGGRGIGDTLKTASIAYALSKQVEFTDFKLHATGFSRSVEDPSLLIRKLRLEKLVLGENSAAGAVAQIQDLDEIVAKEGIPLEKLTARDVGKILNRKKNRLEDGGVLAITFSCTLAHFLRKSIEETGTLHCLSEDFGLYEISSVESAPSPGSLPVVRILFHLRLGDVACISMPSGKCLDLASKSFVPDEQRASYFQIPVAAYPQIIQKISVAVEGKYLPEFTVSTDGYGRAFKRLEKIVQPWSLEPESITQARIRLLELEHERRFRKSFKKSGIRKIYYGERDDFFYSTIEAALAADIVFSFSGEFISSIVTHFVRPDRYPLFIRGPLPNNTSSAAAKRTFLPADVPTQRFSLKTLDSEDTSFATSVVEFLKRRIPPSISPN